MFFSVTPTFSLNIGFEVLLKEGLNLFEVVFALMAKVRFNVGQCIAEFAGLVFE